MVALSLTSRGSVPGRDLVWMPADQFVHLVGWLVEHSSMVRDGITVQAMSTTAYWVAAVFWACACLGVAASVLSAGRRFRSDGV